MKDLSKQKCEACTIDAPLVPEKKFTELLKDLDGWEVIYGDINLLSKTFLFNSYQDSIKFSMEVAELAEEEELPALQQRSAEQDKQQKDHMV